MLEGDGDREIFGSNHVRPVYAVNVMEVNNTNENGKQVLLNVAGQAHGVREGTQFSIYPYHFTDFNQVDRRIALVEIVEMGTNDAWAKVTTNFEKGPIEQGDAVLINPVSIHLKRMVRLVYQDDTKISADIRTNQNNALEQIENYIAKEDTGFLELGAENTDKAHYQVAINEKENMKFGILLAKLYPILIRP